jgi:tRNA-2-methylthio-N6-dimethylallyladenosine synthase
MTTDNLDATGRRKVYLETFGCQMNVLDSQLLRGRLDELGYHFVDEWRQADVILYNTCSVRARAEQKVYSRIGDVGVHKRSHPDVVLGVVGCMAQQQGHDMAQRFNQVDLLCAPSELDQLPALIDRAIERGPSRGPLPPSQAALQDQSRKATPAGGAVQYEDRLERLDMATPILLGESQHSAYVRITRGCNKHCAFCVVPRTRGAEVHRPPDHIIKQCRRLVDTGTVEITLLGQTVNHYHFDHGAAVVINGLEQPQAGSPVGPRGPRALSHRSATRRITTFADLLQRIHDELPELRRLRFITSLPRDFGDDILAVMAACPRICRYLHLPVQSGSNRILKLMNRGYVVETYFDLLDRARATLPDVQIASDLICGFPTESDEDHQMTVDLIRRARFKNCFIFKYSPRPGTVAAASLADDVSEEVKRQRNAELLAVQGEISAAIHKDFVGRRMHVYVESISAKALKSGADDSSANVQLSGRTEGDLIVCFDGDPALIGSTVNVQIERASRLELFGQLASTFVAVGDR